MKNKVFTNATAILTKHKHRMLYTAIDQNKSIIKSLIGDQSPEILFVTSYPDRECGIATYSHDLIHAIQNKFGSSFSLKVCALECKDRLYNHPEEVKYVLNTAIKEEYQLLAKKINKDIKIRLVFVQHEFGLYQGEYGEYLIQLLKDIEAPIVTTFHTILPNPDAKRKEIIQTIVSLSSAIIVMTKTSALLLEHEYGISPDKIEVIHHGTHLAKNMAIPIKNNKHYFGNRYVLSTFGLLNSGKGIETALEALPIIIDKIPNVLYLVIGKTHPTVLKQEGEKYRAFLEQKVIDLGLQGHVKFINSYLSLPELLEYLQRTNIYLFTSTDPFQAVSGTFAYAMASGCPVISTPIPHTIEMLEDNAGIIVDFQNPEQLAQAAIKLLSNPTLLQEMVLNVLHKIAPTAWENSAIAHVKIINKQLKKSIALHYVLPKISLSQIKRLTTDKGMIQFSKVGVPDIDSGYTIDDNARALLSVTKHYQLTHDLDDLKLIDTYLNYILFCQQKEDDFLNYVDENGLFLDRNYDENLEDANGRAIWALGEFSSFDCLFEASYIQRAETALQRVLKNIPNFKSPRAIAFIIKGLYYYNMKRNDAEIAHLIVALADNLVSKFRGISVDKWDWFEDSLTYANSVLPEAMLYAYLSSGSELFKNIALKSFDFLLLNTFKDNQIRVISNKGWNRGEIAHPFGEQPIDVSYTIMTLGIFYDTFQEENYLDRMAVAFNWFLGENHLHQIIYNPCTGGCYDGLEEGHVNLNQGAESTVSYLLARLTMEKYFNKQPVLELYNYSKIKHYDVAL